MGVSYSCLLLDRSLGGNLTLDKRRMVPPFLIKTIMKAPNKCPMCGEVLKWKQVDKSKKGFSLGKAAVGGILLGPVGLLGGALGKKKVYYCCGKCGFEHEYNG